MPTRIRDFLHNLLDLRYGAEDKRIIIDNVKDDSNFSSARFWTLVCAIGLASVGLNINSIPIVIGAMLISPLMGPVVSMGMALSIYDWGLLRRSFRNLLTLTAISIIISTIYFLLTPIDNAQSELLSRTQPTIFDVLIATFGGVAGFIAISRARSNNVIAGVAIATALMPPLCTVGYGLATAQMEFIFGAFYLFLINCIFICLASLTVAKYLKLPKRDYPDAVHKRRVNHIISTITFVIVAPAIFLAYTFVGQNNFNSNVDTFIKEIFTDQGHIVIYEKRSYSRHDKQLVLAFLDENFTEDEINTFRSLLNFYDLDGTQLTIKQDNFVLEEQDWQTVITKLNNSGDTISALEEKLAAEQNADKKPDALLGELRIINDQVYDLALGSVYFGDDEQTMTVFIYSTKEISAADQTQITNWLKERLDQKNILTYYFSEDKPESSAN